MMGPYNKSNETYRYHSVRHSQITENRLSGKGRDHMAYYTKSWKDHNVNFWMAGYNYSNILAQLHFWITFIGVNLTFFPMHFLGLAGMPRRYIDYPEALHGWNQVASYGAYLAGLGTIIFVIMIFEAFIRKRRAENNPWGDGATTLEWTLSSPPPFHTYEDLPRVNN